MILIQFYTFYLLYYINVYKVQIYKKTINCEKQRIFEREKRINLKKE